MSQDDEQPLNGRKVNEFLVLLQLMPLHSAPPTLDQYVKYYRINYLTPIHKLYMLESLQSSRICLSPYHSGRYFIRQVSFLSGWCSSFQPHGQTISTVIQALNSRSWAPFSIFAAVLDTHRILDGPGTPT